MLKTLQDMVWKKNPQAAPSSRPKPQIHKTEYKSRDVAIPKTFLTGPPAKPIVAHDIDFTKTQPQLLPYEGCTAFVLENVLSPEECQQLLRLVEESVPGTEEGEKSDKPWQPALVNVGPGMEVAAPGYRESDRIIWDEQTVVDRLWMRCCRAQNKEMHKFFATCPRRHEYGGPGHWQIKRLNNRMRFLKYSPGQYFKAHIDGPYWYKEGDKEFETFYTVHLYLNDSAAVDDASDLVGGATAFRLQRGDEKQRIDVNPKAGSVLIFQHAKLYHEGATVEKGTKYTMRTDILYEWVPEGK